MISQQISSPLFTKLISKNDEKSSRLENPNWISLNVFQEDIKLNLENILNTRAPQLFIDKHYANLSESVINYGIKDFTHSIYGSKKLQEELCSHIKTLIKNFEPRLQETKVELIDDNEEHRTLKIRIEAVINLKPKPASTVFESYIDLNRQNFIFE